MDVRVVGQAIELESGDMERHLHAFMHLTLDHWSHDTCGYAEDFGLILWKVELEVLNQFDGDSLHLDYTSKWSATIRNANRFELTRNAT